MKPHVDGEAPTSASKSESVRGRLECGRKHLGVVPAYISVLPAGRGDLVVSVGSVVGFRGDAIVNAANVACLGGGGVDGAISAAGGLPLLQARQALPVVKKRFPRDGSQPKLIRCLTGDAVITPGGHLDAKWVIHAVGPIYYGDGRRLARCDRLLAAAYVAAMREARRKKLQTVGFSLISAGVYRGPRSLQHVLDIAVCAIASAIYDGLREVHLVAFTAEEQHCLTTAVRKWERRRDRSSSGAPAAASGPSNGGDGGGGPGLPERGGGGVNNGDDGSDAAHGTSNTGDSTSSHQSSSASGPSESSCGSSETGGRVADANAEIDSTDSTTSPTTLKNAPQTETVRNREAAAFTPDQPVKCCAPRGSPAISPARAGLVPLPADNRDSGHVATLDDSEGPVFDGPEQATPEKNGNSNTAGSSEATAETGGISEYERQRLERVRQNNEMLLALGLAGATSAVAGPSADKKNKAKSSADRMRSKERRREREAKRAAALLGAAGPRRRSTRIRKLANPDSVVTTTNQSVTSQDVQTQQVDEQPEYDFEDSSVFRYLCGGEVEVSENAGGTSASLTLPHSQAPVSSNSSPTTTTSSLAKFAFTGANRASVSGDGDGGTTSNSSAEVDPLVNLKGFATDRSGQTLFDPDLKKIYNIDIGGQRGRLLAAAGHQGRVAVFSLDQMRKTDGQANQNTGDVQVQGRRDSADHCDEDDEVVLPLLSWKASGGWISGCQFVDHKAAASTGTASAPTQHLLTASNKGDVTLWNLFKEAKLASGGRSGRGKSMAQQVASDVVHGGSGIFHLHLLRNNFVTASKDATVAFCQLHGEGMKVVHRFEEAHDSVVKCARLNPLSTSPLIASAGNDRSVVVLDVRTKATAHTIADVSPNALNSVLWRPGNERQLLASGFESNAIRLFDLRKPDKCFSLLRGHEPPTQRSSTIVAPAFVGSSGDYVVTGGVKSKMLHLCVPCVSCSQSQLRAVSAPGYVARVCVCTCFPFS
eukprot:INCI4200.4.p1 GENE.INCI4200.4~~INCI4200.4.p1  ORF type:complete len:989 (+),score=161.67 INCI4200.4:692-3658(+)